MLSKILLAVALLGGFAAHAESSGSQSEFFFQSEAGKSDLTPRIGYSMQTLKPDGATSETKVNGLYNTGVSYEYGLNAMWALEGALYFSSLETDSTPKLKYSGLQNPELTLKGTSGMDWGRLRYGARAGLGFEKSKSVTATQDGNVATGGYSLMPYVGADMNAAGGILGARLSYEFKMERTVDQGTGTDGKIKGGDALGLSAFYEYFFADMLIGGSVNYISEASTKDAADAEIEASGSRTGISVYSRMPMGGWDLIPRLDYDFSRSHYSKYDTIGLSVAARFGF